MIHDYIRKINKRYKTGISTEHSYRSDLQALLENYGKDILVTNEPSRIDCGAPDYIITKKNIPVGYIEAKNIGTSLKKIEKSEQLTRYKFSLDNLILTDYLDYWLYRYGNLVSSTAIAELKNGKVCPLPQNFEDFENLLEDFFSHVGQTIKSAAKLAEMMAGKARLMQSVIEKALMSDSQNEQNRSLKDQMTAFKKILIHDIKPFEFADIYAQTIAYGMFAARLNDQSLEDFSRQEAAELIPKTNPFLRRLFSYIAGPDIDDRITWIVDALADIFRATDVAAILKNFGSSTQMLDPMIHFYETFIAKYNPKLRKSRGIWYTPEPVTNYIVRAVDDILKNEFDLSQGLSDATKTKIRVNIKGNKHKIEKQIHKVQILDPATGTGTFLAEIIKQIYQKFEGQQGIWSSYVEEHLIPRLNGFEILMASYTMAHLRLDLLLKKTGFKPKNQNRYRVFLTNSLENVHPYTDTIFASWLSNEATEANFIKGDTPVMVVIGNPPYSVSSSNKSEWIEKLMKDYKKGLNEKNINPLSDDYIKFIRYAEFFVERNGVGVIGFISNNSFIDGIIHRKMRENLLTTFTKIYILDLHGNISRKERAPDGGKDENVFDIQQGVSINIFVKTKPKKNKKLAEVYHADLFGTRAKKYEALWQNSIEKIHWEKITVKEPYWFFVPKDFKRENIYNAGIKISDLFPINNSGIKTHRDNFVIDFNIETLSDRIESFYSSEKDDSDLHHFFNLKESSSFKINKARKGVFSDNKIVKILYRPFDFRYIYYSKDLIDRDRISVCKHILSKDNLSLIAVRQAVSPGEYMHFTITPFIADNRVFYSNKGIPVIFPLYKYPNDNKKKNNREPNLNMEIVRKFSEVLGIEFSPEKQKDSPFFAPIDILDYIYSVLHSPTYRKHFDDFLKIDFPRIPLPKNQELFWKLVKLGSELRTIHSLEAPKLDIFITTYPKSGNNIVARKIVSKDFEIVDSKKQVGRVWINDEQYFDNVPKNIWEFYIGGYQPAQKWLKVRKGVELHFDDIHHYHKIIVALNETDRLMKEIDKIEIVK